MDGSGAITPPKRVFVFLSSGKDRGEFYHLVPGFILMVTSGFLSFLFSATVSIYTINRHWEAYGAVGVCFAFFAGQEGLEPCLSAVADTIGWGWTVVLLGSLWMTFLVILQPLLVWLGCGKLRAMERSVANQAVWWHSFRSFLFAYVFLVPKDDREPGFWLLWFSCSGLLVLLETIAAVHFEHVVDNPRFGVMHSLRAFSFLILVLSACTRLMMIGWDEFYDWGQGPVGRILLSPNYPAGIGGGGSDSGDAWTGPRRGGMGFALVLLYDLVVIGMDVSVSVLKYMINLADILIDPNTACSQEVELTELVTLSVRLCQSVLDVGRMLFLFQYCGDWPLIRKILARVVAITTIARAVDRTLRATAKMIRGRGLDSNFQNASQAELKSMAADEACAICLKAMKSAKRLDCHHFFHSGCLRRYLNSCKGGDYLCPICRAKIEWHPSGATNLKRNATTGRLGDRHPNHDALPQRNSLRPNLAQGPVFGGNVRTPDSLSRAARRADATLRLGRRFAQAWLGDGTHDARARTRATAVGPGVAQSGRAVATVAASGGAGREARAANEISTFPFLGGPLSYETRPNRREQWGEGMAGEGSTAAFTEIGAIAHHLLEIFPGMSRQVALRSARMARGSVERAVELVLLMPSESTDGVMSTSGSVPESDARVARGEEVGVSGVVRESPQATTFRRRW